MRERRKVRVGLALGSGAARGWAHVGVIRALEQAGIRPDLVCGTSIGALVGAVYAGGELDRFEQWLLGMRVKDVVGLADVSLASGMLKGERLMEFFRGRFIKHPIENLSLPFAAVATDLRTGAEVWLRDGSAIDAVRASIALPAVFTPVLHDGRTLVDGGLVNPVPVSLARAMGADVVIAVDLSSEMLDHHLTKDTGDEAGGHSIGDWIRRLQENLAGRLSADSPDESRLPAMRDVVASSINIMQVRIARSRLAGDPPDVVVSPRLGRFGLFDFHRASDAIAEGRRATESVRQNLDLLRK